MIATTIAPSALPAYLTRGEDLSAGERGTPIPIGAGMTAKVPFKEVRIADCVYPLASPITLSHSWDDGEWLCWADDLGASFIGRAPTLPDAVQEWRRMFHAEFQKLYAMRPFEMTAQEADRWGRLVVAVDVASYRRANPLSYQAIGCIRFDHRPYPTRFIWLDGRHDRIDFDAVPPELAGFRPGQWVRATIKRDSQSMELLQVVSVERIPTPHRMGARTLDDYWSRMPSAEVVERDVLNPGRDDEEREVSR